MKVWISKYALSGGIKEAEVRQSASNLRYVYPIGSHGSLLLWRSAHETRESAIKAAEQMRLKKIASLKKQIAKLEAMKFE